MMKTFLALPTITCPECWEILMGDLQPDDSVLVTHSRNQASLCSLKDKTFRLRKIEIPTISLEFVK